MYKNLLPVGSVVLLKGGQKRVMICGRVQARVGENKIYDYAACRYPEGIIDPSEMFLFDHSSIEMVYFVGFQDQEEFEFKDTVLSELGEILARRGAIAPENL